jgi:hypothetical protein
MSSRRRRGAVMALTATVALGLTGCDGDEVRTGAAAAAGHGSEQAAASTTSASVASDEAPAPSTATVPEAQTAAAPVPENTPAVQGSPAQRPAPAPAPVPAPAPGPDAEYLGPAIVRDENDNMVQLPDYTENGISTWVTLTNKSCTGSEGAYTLSFGLLFSDGHRQNFGSLTMPRPYVMNLEIDPGYQGRNSFNPANPDFEMCPGL